MFTLLLIVVVTVVISQVVLQMVQHAAPRMQSAAGAWLGALCLSTGVLAFGMLMYVQMPADLLIGSAVAAQQADSGSAAESSDETSQTSQTSPTRSDETAEADRTTNAAAEAAEDSDQPAQSGLPLEADGPSTDLPPLPTVEDPAADVLSSGVLIDYEARPAWVESAPVLDAPIHQIAVSGGPDVNLRDCRRRLAEEAESAVDQYIDSLVNHPGAHRFIGYNQEQVMSNLVDPDKVYQEQIVSPTFGALHQLHALIEIDEWTRQEIEQRWNTTVTRSRLGALGLVSGGVLALIAVLFSYFRLDTATRGFYTGRLQFAAAVAILALVAAGVLLSQTITWM